MTQVAANIVFELVEEIENSMKKVFWLFVHLFFSFLLTPYSLFMSGRRDSNPESPLPKRGMLAVTPRPDLLIPIHFPLLIGE